VGSKKVARRLGLLQLLVQLRLRLLGRLHGCSVSLGVRTRRRRRDHGHGASLVA